MALPNVSHSALDSFAPVAAAYCQFIDRASELSGVELLQEAHRLLPGLYAAGLALPPTGILFPSPVGTDSETTMTDLSTDPDENEDPDRGTTAQMSAIAVTISSKIGKHNFYREVYDPYESHSAKEVMGSLSDDLSDIYRDLHSGLCKWRRGESGEALWEWRFNLEIHWGRHVVNALRAINALTANYELEWPDSSHGAT